MFTLKSFVYVVNINQFKIINAFNLKVHKMLHNIVAEAYFFFLSHKPLWFRICGESSFDFDYETLKATLR